MIESHRGSRIMGNGESVDLVWWFVRLEANFAGIPNAIRINHWSRVSRPVVRGLFRSECQVGRPASQQADHQEQPGIWANFRQPYSAHTPPINQPFIIMIPFDRAGSGNHWSGSQSVRPGQIRDNFRGTLIAIIVGPAHRNSIAKCGSHFTVNGSIMTVFRQQIPPAVKSSPGCCRRPNGQAFLRKWSIYGCSFRNMRESYYKHT